MKQRRAESAGHRDANGLLLALGNPQLTMQITRFFLRTVYYCPENCKFPSVMAYTVRHLCKPYDSAFSYVIGNQVEKLEQVVRGNAAEEFFSEEYVTVGLRVLLREGLARLAGKSGQALFELRQAMGGGKTHSMIALGLLAQESRPKIKAPFRSASSQSVRVGAGGGNRGPQH